MPGQAAWRPGNNEVMAATRGTSTDIRSFGHGIQADAAGVRLQSQRSGVQAQRPPGIIDEQPGPHAGRNHRAPSPTVCGHGSCAPAPGPAIRRTILGINIAFQRVAAAQALRPWRRHPYAICG
jgi:hypothetical protein